MFEREPLDPQAAKLFQGVPNLILSPHVAGHTGEADVRISLMVARAVLDVLSEEPAR